MINWLPINDDTPRDGSSLLLRWPDGRIGTGHWIGHSVRGHFTLDKTAFPAWYVTHPPTHWSQLNQPGDME